MVDRPGRWLEPINLIGAGDAGLSTVRNTLRRLHNMGLLDRKVVKPKFDEFPSTLYRVRPGVSKVELVERKPARPTTCSAGVLARVLAALEPGPLRTTEVQAALGLKQTAVLKALGLALDAGIVTREQGEAKAGGQRPWIWSLAETQRAAG